MSTISKKDQSPLIKSLIESVNGMQSGERKRPKLSMAMADPFQATERKENMSLSKSIMNLLDGEGDTIERLAFEKDPTINLTYQSLYRIKQRLLPDDVLKRISIQDDLVAAICNARSNQVSAFGRPQPDRFSTGFKIEPEPGLMDGMDEEEKKLFQKRIAQLEKKLLTCGDTAGYRDQDALTFGQFLYMAGRNACVFGRIAIEAIYKDTMDGTKKFHSFRPIDAGTIFKAAPQKEAAESVRESAVRLMETMENKKFKPEKFKNDEYAWVQVIAGRAVQAFTAEECLVHNFYPVTDIELDGYPLTPLDTVIAAVVTHINITSHNRLYFQSGRAARGMIVVKSDEVDEGIVKHIRQTFQASINSVNNAWRMPIFGIGAEDEVTWTPIDSGSRDMEFQYLSDTNARVILSAFQMSPEELPGYAHLSRGTNNQAMSESNNEYKLEAHRDVGIRPLLAQLQNFVNMRLLPLLDEDLSKQCSVKFMGLDVETAEKESVRIQQDQAVHMTIDEVMEKVEKKPIGPEFGGRFLLNPQWQAQIDKYVKVGVIVEKFFGVKDASKDPTLQYIRDPFWFQYQDLLMQQAMAQQQAQQPQGQPPGGGGDGGGGGGEQTQGGNDGSGQVNDDAQGGEEDPSQGEGGEGSAMTENQKTAAAADSTGPQDLSRSLDQLVGILTKSEAQLPQSKRLLVAQQRMFVKRAMDVWEKESEDALKDILQVAQGAVKAKKKN